VQSPLLSQSPSIVNERPCWAFDPAGPHLNTEWHDDYVQECRKVALECLDKADIQNAPALMMDSMQRLPGAVSLVRPIDVIWAVSRGDAVTARAYIEGFE